MAVFVDGSLSRIRGRQPVSLRWFACAHYGMAVSLMALRCGAPPLPPRLRGGDSRRSADGAVRFPSVDGAMGGTARHAAATMRWFDDMGGMDANGVDTAFASTQPDPAAV